jgi:CRP-like cAMP-binding protein
MRTGEPPQPFLQRLDDAARLMLLSIAQPVSFARGACLVRAGEASRGAYVIREGQAEASVLLPGGERLVVAKLGPGSLFGEMALFERGIATATVAAGTNLDGWFLDRDDFRALAAQRTPEARGLQHALTVILMQKLRAMNAKVLEAAAPEDAPVVKSHIADPLAGVKRSGKTAFDFRPFLPLLPVFDGFTDAEIAEVMDASRLVDLQRGHGVFAVGQPAAAFVVLRGAVEIYARREARERRMAVLGPGQIFGFMSLLDGGAHGSEARVRETAILLEIPRKAFDGFYAGEGAISTVLHHAIQRSLLSSLAQTNRHLTRLISLARLRGARREGDKLETALGGQIVAAPLPASSVPAA